MGRSNGDSMVVELPLKVNTKEKKKLLAHFEAGRQIYNACLKEALQRRNLMYRSKIYKQAKKLPHKTEEEKKLRDALFQEVRVRCGFTEYSLHEYVAKIRNSWLKEHIDINTAQKLASRAYSTVNKTVTGEAKHVCFKRYGELNSLEGKDNKSGIKWRDGYVKWNGLELKAIINKKDNVTAYGLSLPVKFVRIVKKQMHGKILFYVQLVCKGKPYIKEKNKAGEETVGLDFGPSTIAVAGDTKARLELLCGELNDIERKIRVIQRKMDRQRRANNPDNYNADGTIKKGKLKWKNSKSYMETRNKYAELNRRHAEYRKSLHGKLANEIIRLGNRIYTEKISYKGWQKIFGKSIGKRAPGKLVNMLKRKAEATGGFLIEFPTMDTALSQKCQCGRKKKKKLNERWHKCMCGVNMQRDLYSALLARHVKEKGKYYLDTKSAKEEWESIKPILDKAIEEARHRYKKIPSSFGI